jgi:hypothetical protein
MRSRISRHVDLYSPVHYNVGSQELGVQFPQTCHLNVLVSHSDGKIHGSFSRIPLREIGHCQLQYRVMCCTLFIHAG